MFGYYITWPFAHGDIFPVTEVSPRLQLYFILNSLPKTAPLTDITFIVAILTQT